MIKAFFSLSYASIFYLSGQKQIVSLNPKKVNMLQRKQTYGKLGCMNFYIHTSCQSFGEKYA